LADFAQGALLATQFIPIAVELIDPLPSGKAAAVYRINSWSSAPDEDVECLAIASTACYWLLKVLQELHHSTAKAATVEKQTLSFRPFSNFFLRLQSTSSEPSSAERPEFVETDCGMLLIVAELLEAFLLDVDVARKEIGVPSVILPLFDFVEANAVPASWRNSAAHRDDWQLITSAIAKSLTAVATEDSVMDACFESVEADSEGQSMGQVLDRLHGWLGQTDRDDSLVCASVMLANLARSGSCPAVIDFSF
jgi:hypothetical protein